MNRPLPHPTAASSQTMPPAARGNQRHGREAGRDASTSIDAVKPSLLANPSSPTGEAGAPNLSKPFVRIAGEAIDADQVGWTCDSCGFDEYRCDCEVDCTPAGPTMTVEEAHARIAAVFLGVAR